MSNKNIKYSKKILQYENKGIMPINNILRTGRRKKNYQFKNMVLTAHNSKLFTSVEKDIKTVESNAVENLKNIVTLVVDFCFIDPIYTNFFIQVIYTCLLIYIKLT